MFSEKIIRWSGLSLALGGILIALFWILHPEETVLLTDPAGFLLTLLSLLVLIGVSVVDMLIWPSITSIQPDLILTPQGEFNQASGPFAATISLIVPFAMIGALGYILLGIAIWRSNLMPRWAGLLLAVAGPLYSLGPGFVPHAYLLPNLLVYGPFAFASLWLGSALLKASEETAQTATGHDERETMSA